MTIKPGDLVMVVDGCCERARASGVGAVFTVREVIENIDWFMGLKVIPVCMHCKQDVPTTYVVASQQWRDAGGILLDGAPLPWVRKIDPPKAAIKVKRSEPEEVPA